MGVSPWEFKSPPRHFFPALRLNENAVVSRIYVGGSSSAVERLLAKEEVASSNLVFRSSLFSGMAV